MATITQTEHDEPEAQRYILVDKVPESLHRDVKACAAKSGKTLKKYCADVLAAAVAQEKEDAS